MQRWGIVVTAYYAAVLLLLAALVPGSYYVLLGDDRDVGLALFDPRHLSEGVWLPWLMALVFVASAVLLLCLSVDTSHKRLRPRTRVGLSVAATAGAIGLLTITAFWAIAFGIWADSPPFAEWFFLTTPFGFWLFWGVVFFLYREGVSRRLERTLSWIINGSVLELLIAVPAHIVVRQRGDCSAPIATAFGISTGIAVMLLAFGPSVVLLYQKRLRAYDGEAAGAPWIHRWPAGKILCAVLLGAVALFLLLPFDARWTLAYELPVERSAAARAAVEQLATSFGMTTLAVADTSMEIVCDGHSAVSIEVIEITAGPGSGTEYWSVSGGTSEADLYRALDALLDEIDTPTLETIVVEPEPLAPLVDWRARVLARLYGHESCHRS